jgi:hypothetical protein
MNARPVSAEQEFGADPAGTQDVPLRGPDGQPLTEIEGVVVKVLTPHMDHRGTLVEAINLEDPFWHEPVVHAYKFTVKPGTIKGWGMHRKQADRYFTCSGSMRVVLYDGRVDSPTHKHLAHYSFTDDVSALVYIPAPGRSPSIGPFATADPPWISRSTRTRGSAGFLVCSVRRPCWPGT